MAKQKNNLSGILPNPLNPRRIKPGRAAKLAEYLDEFGDLGGIVDNANPECPGLVTAHQRMEVFKREGGVLVLVEEYAEAQPDGTIARGYVEMGGKRYQYRRVYWEKHKADRAIIVANGAFGEWDVEKLSLWEFEPDELEDFGVKWEAEDGEEDEYGSGVPNNALNSEKVEPDPFDDPGITAKNQFGVVVICDGEATQAEVYERLTSEGFSCKILVV